MSGGKSDRAAAIRRKLGFLCLVGNLALGSHAPLAAEPPGDTLRPKPRAEAFLHRDRPAEETAAVSKTAPAASIRPAPRLGPKTERPSSPERLSAPMLADFRRWRMGFRKRALKAGISPTVFDKAFRGVEPDPAIIARDRSQSEFTRQIWEYLDRAVSPTRIAKGREKLEQHRHLLARIERRYGVEKEIVLAIWGLESAYGAHRGKTPTIRALATLAHDGRRKRFFESELIAAMRILQAGDTTPDRMKGSWAGAMGHTQFMPSSYLAFAQDFTGDGRRDIWSDNPADALASTANYLARYGWKKGQPWGVEVRLPKGFDYRLAGEHTRKPVAFWRAKGLRLADGRPLPDHGPASLRLPAGARGPALLTFDNFRVIERYNPADAYVIAVGHLADRIAGRPPFRAGWPRGERALSADEKRELQRLLSRKGYDTGGIDGVIGPRTIGALQAWQRDAGLVPDGFPSVRLLRMLD